MTSVDADGEEVGCTHHADNLGRAWESGCRRADRYGVECVELDAQGQPCDRYTPEGDDAPVDAEDES